MRTKSIDVDALIEDYKTNTNLKELAYKYGLSIEGIRYHLIHSGVYQRQRVSPGKEIMLERFKNIDTSKYTSTELWWKVKDIYPKRSTVRQMLSSLDIPFKKIKQGRPYKGSRSENEKR